MYFALLHHVAVERDVDRATIRSDRFPVRQRGLAACFVGAAKIEDAKQRDAAEIDRHRRVRFRDALRDKQRHRWVSDYRDLPAVAPPAQAGVNIKQRSTTRF